MKNTLLLLIFSLLAPADVMSQKPEKIYGKNRVLKTNEYYIEQMALWKRETENDPKNGDAWYNYYRANRNAYIVGEEKRTLEGKGNTRFDRLNSIVAQIEKNVPGSFECNYVKWLNSNGDPAFFQYLEKAHALSPQRTEPLMDLVIYYEKTGEYSLKHTYAKEYYKSGEYSPGLLNYSYNMLSGLEKDAIIITEGDKDTEGTWILQAAKAIRTDINLLNINFLYIKEFRERVFKELEIPQLDYDPQANNENYEKFNRGIVAHIARNGKKRPVYAGATLSATYTAQITSRLHLTGLAALYSEASLNTEPVLQKNYEEIYALDYLKIYLPADLSAGNVQQFNLNYMPSLAALRNYYASLKNTAGVAYCEELGQKLAADAGNMAEYEKYFGAK